MASFIHFLFVKIRFKRGGAVRLHALQRQQHPLPDRLLPAGHDRVAFKPRDGAEAGRRPDVHADRRHRGHGDVVADDVVAVVGMVRVDDGAVYIHFRDPHLRRWHQAADA